MFVHDFDLAKQLCNDDRFLGRSLSHYATYVRGYGRKIGIVSTEGPTWKVHRRFTLSSLKGRHVPILLFINMISSYMLTQISDSARPA